MKKYRVSLEVDEEWVKNFDLVFDAEDEGEACNEAMMQVKMNLGDYITAYADEEENNDTIWNRRKNNKLNWKRTRW